MPAPIRGFLNKQMLTWTEQSGYTCLLEKFQAQRGGTAGCPEQPDPPLLSPDNIME